MIGLTGRTGAGCTTVSDILSKQDMKDMEWVLNTQKINEYVLNFIQEQNEISASKLSLKTTEDFVHLIYVNRNVSMWWRKWERHIKLII